MKSFEKPTDWFVMKSIVTNNKKGMKTNYGLIHKNTKIQEEYLYN